MAMGCFLLSCKLVAFYSVIAAICAVQLFMLASAYAYDRKAEQVLQGLNAETRQVKVCELEALTRIERDKNGLHPEHVMIDYLKSPHRSGNDNLWGNHALLRSKGVWYYLAYQCTTTKDRFRVTHFSYKLGKRIKRSEWDELGLFP